MKVVQIISSNSVNMQFFCIYTILEPKYNDNQSISYQGIYDIVF